jgi:nucleoside-diphosphate-sugar epimerase
METLEGMTPTTPRQAVPQRNALHGAGDVSIVGSGLLATAFAQNFQSEEQICVFASGVSNSSEQQPEPFQREARLLGEALARSPQLLYFSSCALANPSTDDTPYFAHKREMEQAVLAASPRNLVLRLPQVVGNTPNPHTLTNFLYSRISTGEPFSIWSRAERNLIDVDDIARIATALVRARPDERVIAVAAKRSLRMLEIVSLFEQVLGKRASFTAEDRGNALPIDSALCQRIAHGLGLDLGEGYAAQIIRKYYAP